MNPLLDARAICDALPAADPEDLLADVQRALADYDRQREFSRDTFPTAPQMKARLEMVERYISLAFGELVMEPRSDSIALIGMLSAMLDGTEEASTSYLKQISELIHTAREAIDKLAQPLKVDGKTHQRKTRYAVRDSYLIPMLTAIAEAHGKLNLRGDWEDVDTACAFVATVLSSAGIPTPDAGDTSRAGESAQGRLRRLIKNAAAENHRPA
jgi:hypothetical protein